VNTQQISAVVRQTLAIAAIVMGALTQALNGIKLPVAISTVLAVGGAVILAVEHYVSDPSTGSSTPTPPAPPAAPTVLPTFSTTPPQAH
jgi:hypothetical protein